MTNAVILIQLVYTSMHVLDDRHSSDEEDDSDEEDRDLRDREDDDDDEDDEDPEDELLVDSLESDSSPA